MISALPRLVARLPASVHVKLLVAFLATITLFVVMGAVGLGVLQGANDRAEVLIELQRRIAAYRQIYGNGTQVLYTISSAFLATDEEDFAVAERRMGQFSYDFDRARFVSGDNADVLAEIEEDYQELVGVGLAVFRLIRSGEVEEARALQAGSAIPLARRIERNALSLVNRAESEMLVEAEAGNQAFVTSQYVVVLVALASVLVALLLGYAISWSVVSPVKRINERLKEIAGGDFTTRIDVPNRDELGELAGAVNRMSGDLDALYRQLEDVSRHKSDFLATMSHEIRTPMNAMLGMTQLIMDTELDREQRQFARTIRDSAQALMAIINDILDFSKVEAGKLELENEPFNLAECVEGAFDIVAPEAAKKGLELAVDIAPGTTETLVGDIVRVRQILVNLLGNAVKFTEEGEVVVEVSCTTLESKDGGGPRNEFLFAVRDTGVGIPADRLDRLFKSFSQVDASTTRKYGGTGLGLAICKQLAELMGGRIWVESTFGLGSTFSFTIVSAQPVGAGQSFAPETDYLKDKKVLIIAPEAFTGRRVLAQQLTTWGLVPQATASTTEALGWIRAGRAFDLVMVDLDTPDLDVAGFAEALGSHGAGRDLPLLAMRSARAPGSAAPTEVETARFAGTVSKPVKQSMLFDALAGILGREVARMAPVEAGGSEFERGLAAEIPLRILLVDDHPTNRLLGRKILERLGYDADVAPGGVEALEVLEEETYDIVFMDVQMPELDGLETTREIRRRWPDRDLRVVAMTANAMSGDREACLAAGMDDYLSKPVNLDALVAVLRSSGVPREERVEPAPSASGPESMGPVTASDSTSPPPSILDPDALARLLAMIGGDEASLRELIESFLGEAPSLLEDLRAALERDDAEGMRTAAHTLKSSSADFGAMELSALCRELEAKSRDGDLDGVSDLVSRAEAEFDPVRRELEERAYAWPHPLRTTDA